MALVEFYRGSFARPKEYDHRTVEWEGTEQGAQDIEDWINQAIVDFLGDGPLHNQPWPQWNVSFSSDPVTATFAGGWDGRVVECFNGNWVHEGEAIPNTGGGFLFGTTGTLVLNPGDWIAYWDERLVGDLLVRKDEFWRTSNTSYRPDNVEDFFAPGTVFPWD